MTNESGAPRLEASFSELGLRAALGAFATGITVLTCRGVDGKPVGLTVNSFNSVSLDPPLIVWSLAADSPMLRDFEACTHYAVNVLTLDQLDLSQRFAAREDDKFRDLEVTEGAGGAPLIARCGAWFECRNETRHAGGDHILFLGRVERVAKGSGQPLVYHGGRYRRLAIDGEF